MDGEAQLSLGHLTVLPAGSAYLFRGTRPSLQSTTSMGGWQICRWIGRWSVCTGCQ